MKSLQAAVDCTSKKKRSTLEVTTSRNKRLERSLPCARSKVPHKWKNGRSQSSPENFIYRVTSWPTVLSMKAVVSLEGKYHHSSKRISWQLHITLKLLQLNWFYLYQHLFANIYINNSKIYTHKCLSFTKLRTVGWLKICFHSYPTMKTVLKVIVLDPLFMLSALLKIIISEFFHKPCSSLKKTLSKFLYELSEKILKLICLIWKKLALILVHRKTRETNKK